MLGVYVDDFPMDELNAKVFSREPLRPDEKVVACFDHAIVRSWSKGIVITNLALLHISRKKVTRFDYAKMTRVTYFSSQDAEELRFEYAGKKKTFYLSRQNGFDQVVKRTFPPKSIPYHKFGCSRCGKRDTIISAEWKAGNKVGTKVVSVEGNTMTSETTYTDIISISASLCAECFDELAEERLKKKKDDNLFMLIGSAIAVAIGVIALIIWASDFFLASLLAIVGGFFGLVASLKPIIKKELKKDDPTDEMLGRYHLEDFAESKMLDMKRSILWTPWEFERLKIMSVRQ